MKTLIATLLLTLSAFAQTATPAPVPDTPQPSTTFSLSASAVALPGNRQTLAASVIGGTFAITPNFALRQDNIVGSGIQGYFGGVQYYLPALSKKLNSVSLFDASHFQFYLTASAGIDQAAARHYAFLAGGGVNYDPSGTGKFSVNLGEVRYAKLPGFANSTAIVSSGLKLGW